jgi:outer membrane protein assembly factor BamA
MLRATLLSAFLTVALALTAQEQLKIVKLSAIGSHRYSSAEIVRASGLRIGEPFSDAAVAAAAHRLARSGVFSEVDDVTAENWVPQHGMEVRFSVTDGGRLLPVEFENFSPITGSEITRYLGSHVPLFEGRVPSNGNLNDDVRLALTKLLRERHLRGTVAVHLSMTASSTGLSGGRIIYVRTNR